MNCKTIVKKHLRACRNIKTEKAQKQPHAATQ